MAFVNGNIAREAGRLHAWRERFWGRRYRAIVVADGDEAAQIARFRYLLAQGCKEGLVASPRDWPGVSSVPALLWGERLRGIWVDRTALFRARLKDPKASESTFRTSYDVALTPLPCWAHLDAAEYQRACADLVSHIEAETKQANRENGVRPMGRERVLKLDPHRVPVQSKRSPAPLVHASNRARREAFMQAYRAFVDCYRSAARLVRDGATFWWRQFPAGSFAPPGPFCTGAEAPGPTNTSTPGFL
jgi:hypothetical protein